MTETTTSKATVFNGKILNVTVHQVNAKGGPAVREIIEHGPAVCLIIERNDGKFIFIRQFRKAMEREILEVCAGNCDAGESASESAKRELTEETGYRADEIYPLGPIFPCVGYCTERIDVFYAKVSEQGETDFDEDEEIETLELSRAEIDQLIRSNEMDDAKTLASWLKFEKSDFNRA